MLSGKEIHRRVKDGSIVFTPFNEDQVNPNSYNLQLGDSLKIYKDALPKGVRPWIPVKANGKYSVLDWYDSWWDYIKDIFRPSHYMPNPKFALDPHAKRETIEIKIPETGLIVRPGVLYLGTTKEHVAAKDTVPMLDGRSSIGRLGIYIHVTAGFGDVGWGWDFEKNMPRHGGTGAPWTTEHQVLHPVIFYPGMQIGQMRFEEISADFTPYVGRYKDQLGPQETNFHINKGRKLGTAAK